MTNNLPSSFVLSQEVARALERELPVVALESTVITHGLPYPENLTLAEGKVVNASFKATAIHVVRRRPER